jgi:LuxR family maltose regulon positive regulatory protein
MAQAKPASRIASWARYRAPDPPSGSIDRPRLLAALEVATAQHPVTVVAAPSGYGKTTAVASWAASHAGAVAWLSLGSADIDPAMLASGVVESLQVQSSRGPHASGAFLGIDPEGGIKAAYRQICRAAQDLDEAVYLVVDDAQRAGEGLGAGLLGLLLESRPDQLHLVLVGTSFLELAMSRLLLTEPGALVPSASLAFDVEELSRLCVHFGSGLRIQDLMEDCRGWPIATRMAILGGERPAAAEQDAHTRLGDYVRDHVLAALPGHLASFILTATACSVLTPDLAVAVSGRDDAGALLEDLARRGIFLHRFDLDGRVAYRWHPVFARQCGRILSTGQRAQWREAHARAAQFLEAADPLASMGHLVAAGAVERAVDTLARCWVGLLVDDQAAAVAQWCAALPDGAAKDPRVLLVWACAEDIIGEHRVARTRFARATRLAARDGPDGGAGTVLRLTRLFLVDDRDEALQACADVHALLASPDAVDRRAQAPVLFLLGWNELRLQVFPGLGQELLSAAAREAGALGDLALERRALSHLASATAWCGNHRRAREILDRLASQPEPPTLTWAYYGGGGGALAAGCMAYWSADYATAHSELIRAIESDGTRMSFTGVARMVLALNAAASHDPAMRRRAAAELQGLPHGDVHGVDWSVFRDTAVAVLDEAAGHRARAVALAERHAAALDRPFVGVALSGILRRAGDPVAALHLLAHHRALVGISYVRVATRATAALVHKHRGEPDLAHELCESALDTAEAEDIRAPFCDGDLDMRLLLADHLSRRTRHEGFITACLTMSPAGGVLEALSERERDVFRLLQTSRTIREIAQELYVSVNTVKTHQRAIYRKLGVQSRREAQRVAP